MSRSLAVLGTGEGRRYGSRNRGWIPSVVADRALLVRLAWLAGGFAAAAVAGVAVSRAGRLPHLVLAAEAGGALFIIVWRLGARSLWIWAVASAPLYPFLRVPSSHPIITFDRVWILASLSCVLLNRRRITTSRPTRLLLLTLSWLAISFGVRAFTTSGPDLGFDAITLWLDTVILPLILFLAAAKLTFTRRQAQGLGAAIALGGAVLACIGIAEKALGFELATYSGGSARFDEAIGTIRISGPYPAPEPYALSLLICFAATLYWIQVRRPRPYFLGGSALVLQAAAIALTFFRAAWIVGVVVLFVLLTRRGRHARTALIIVYGTAAALLAFTLLQHNRQFAARAENTKNIDTRLAAYEQSLEIFRMKPYFGVGIDQYPNVASTLPATEVNGVASVPYPHNSYLGVLAEQGIFGVAPLIAATFAVWYALRRFTKRMRSRDDEILATGVRAAAIAYLLMSLPLDMFSYGPSNAFFALFLGAACGRFEALGPPSKSRPQALHGVEA